MDINDDYFQKRNDNQFTITNRCVYDKPTILTQNNVNDIAIPLQVKTIKFIQFMNEESQQQNKDIRQQIYKELMNAKISLGSLIFMIDCASKEQIKLLKVKHININERKVLKVNYLKKVNNFSKCVALYKSKLTKEKEKCKQNKEIFDELSKLKAMGFYIDDNNFNLGNMETYLDADNIDINLHNKYILNFDKILNINKYCFVLHLSKANNSNSSNISNSNSKYTSSFNIELKNYFHKQFTKRYKIIFEFYYCQEDKQQNKLEFYEGDMEEIINDIIKKKISYLKIQNEPRYSKSFEQYFLFYFKYLLYKFIKREANEIKRQGKNTFIFKGFLFTLTKNGNEVIIEITYYNHCKILFRVKKADITKQDPRRNHKFDLIKKSHRFTLIKMFIHNLFYDISLHNVIKNFHNIITNTSKFEILLNETVLVKNVVKIMKVFFRQFVFDTIERYIIESKRFHVTKCLQYKTILDYCQIKYCLNAKKTWVKHPLLEFSVEFNNKGNITVTIKDQFDSKAYKYEKNHLVSKQYERLDVNCLLSILDHYIFI